MNRPMKRLSPILILWILIIVFFPARRASAQHGEPPPPPPDAWKGQVSGKVINQTSGETVAEPVEVMLHAWDPEDRERMMVHGKAELDGTFLFKEVDFHQDFSYSIMATYLGTTYFSQLAKVQKGETTLTLDAQVYGTTRDLSGLRIDQLHLLFYIKAGQLGVTQLYTLSNIGNLTIKDTVILPRERTGTLKFHLPDEAQNVYFGNDPSGSRYVLLPGGFADTAPVPPGEGTSRVVVAYNLPYSGTLAYTYLAPVAVDRMSLLVQESSGLTLEGEDLTPADEQSLADGTKFKVYTASSLEPGEIMQLTLRGKVEGVAAPSASTAGVGSNIGLVIGMGVLGMALLGAGVWWWRRTDKAVEEIREDTNEGILAEIQTLDEAYERGELSEEEYQETRDSLHDRLKSIVEHALQ